MKKQAEAYTIGKKYQKVKLHVLENKKVYISGAAGISIGIGIGSAATLILMGNPKIDVHLAVNNY